MAIVYFIYFIELLLLVLITLLVCCVGNKLNCLKIRNRMAKRLVFSEILSILIQGALEFYICGYLNY